MRLTPPSFPVFFMATLSGGLGLAARLGYLPTLAPIAFWLVAIGFALLFLGSLFRGL